MFIAPQAIGFENWVAAPSYSISQIYFNIHEQLWCITSVNVFLYWVFELDMNK